MEHDSTTSRGHQRPFILASKAVCGCECSAGAGATGSAAAAFVGYLARRLSAKSGQWHWRIEQGIEMGRPSLLEIRLEKQADNITTIGVGGASVLVSEGVMEVPTLDN